MGEKCTTSSVRRISLVVSLCSLTMFGPPAAAAGDAAKGGTVYTANCMACHGVNADGKGPAAAAFQPKPTDFTSATFWLDRKDDGIKAVVRTGRPGTPMMPFGKLSEADLDNLVAFLRTKAPAGG
jgi:mono/diheme cytochrome c family protein